MRASIAALAVLGALAWLTASAALADDEDAIQLTKMRFFEKGTTLQVATSLTRLFDSASYDKLDSGFESTVVIRCFVYPKEGTTPVAVQLVQRIVRFRVWDEDYVIRFNEGGAERVVIVKYKAEALKLLTSIDGLPIALLRNLPFEKQYVLAMIVELNPVSQETLAEVRRWLSEGTGGGLERGGSFFGSFVSLFVNLKIPDADRVLRLQSQPFYRPTPPPPPAPVPAETVYPRPPPPPPAAKPPPAAAKSPPAATKPPGPSPRKP